MFSSLICSILCFRFAEEPAQLLDSGLAVVDDAATGRRKMVNSAQ